MIASFLHRFRALIILVVVGLMTYGRALPAKELRPLSAESTLIELEEAFVTDPKVLKIWGSKQFDSLDPETSPVAWVRVFWALIMSLENPTAFPEFDKRIDQAIRIAETHRLLEEEVSLTLLRSGVNIWQYNGPFNSTTERILRDGIDRAAKLSSDRLRIRWIFTLVYFLDIIESPEKIVWMNEGMNLMKNNSDLTPVDQLRIRTIMAILFSVERQAQRSEELNLENEKLAEAEGWFKSLAITTYNLGFHFEQKKEFQKAEQYFSKAYAAGAKINDIGEMASAKLGLGGIARKRGQFETALTLAMQASDLFEKGGDVVWQSYALNDAAQALIGLKKYQEAFSINEKSSGMMPETYQKKRQLILKVKAQALFGMGQTEAAFALLKQYADSFEKMVEDRENANTSQLSITMGLKMEELKNSALARENDLNRQLLSESQKIKAAVYAVLVISLFAILVLVYALSRAQLVRRSQIKMRRILNAIEEGIVTIDSHFRIEAEYSVYLRKLFQHTGDLAGQDIVQLIYPGASQRSESASMMQETLRACMGEDAIGWELNAHHLPQELNVSIQGQDRHLLLSWQPLTNRHGQMINILLSIRDNTERRRLEKNLQTYELEQQLVQELFGNQLHLIEDTLRRAETAIAWSDPSALTRLHTIKGEARTLSLNTLSAAVHDLEDHIKTSEQGRPASLNAEKFRELLGHYRKILHQFGFSAAIKIDKEWSLLAAVQPLMQAAKSQFEQANLHLDRIEVIDGIVEWPEALFKDVTDIVLHALTNSIDHGFLIPAGSGIKVAHPKLSIACERKDGDWHVVIRDNGVGLNLEKLRALSQSRGFRPASDQTWADVVFEVGVSTAEILTISSGRGVGLAAIREIAEKRGGRVRIRPAESGTGTELEVILPTTLGSSAAGSF